MITLTGGLIQNASNLAVPNGSIEFVLNVDATVIAAPYGLVMANVPITFQFDANGNIQSGAQIWSNEELTPQNGIGLGTYYSVTFYDADGARLNQVPMGWQFTEPANSTVDISQMTAYITAGTSIIYYPNIFSGNNIYTGNNTFTGKNTFANGVPNPAMKPFSADAVQYVTTEGNDSNDGLSWGTAKLTIAAAYAALPPCTWTNYFTDSGSYQSPPNTWSHGGRIYLGSGIFDVFSQITIESPFVRIEGAAPGSTYLNYTGTSGACLYWTSDPFQDEFIGSGGLHNICVDGRNSSAGCIGLQTNDISAFHMSNVVIQNFSGTGSIGWLDSTTSWYNEKMVVEVTLKNNKINWQVNPTNPDQTFGYGTFDVHIETFSGQVGFQMVNGTLAYSTVHMTINQVSNPADADAIQIQNTAIWGPNTYAIEIESPEGIGTGHEINITSSAPDPFFGVGTIFQGLMQSNIYSGGHYLPPQGNLFWPTFQTVDGNPEGTPNIVFRLDPNGVGQSLAQVIDVFATAAASYQVNYWPTSAGVLALQSTVAIKHGSNSGNYTGANTAYAVVDGTDLAYAVVIPTGWRLVIFTSGGLTTATAAVSVNVAIADGGTPICQVAGTPSAPGSVIPWSMSWVIVGDGASHAITLQASTANASDNWVLLNSSGFIPTMTFLLMPSN